MTVYQASLDTKRPAAQVFAYLSDFSTTAEWDPGVIAAKRIDTGPIGVGTEFHLTSKFLGRTTELTYVIIEHDPPNSVTLLGQNASAISRDTITVAGQREETRIDYRAELTLKGPLRILDPLLALAFKRVGDRALAGLLRTLDGRPATQERPR